MSSTLPGQLLTVYVLATVLAALGGAWLAHRYRAALLPLMRAPLAPASSLHPAEVAAALPPWREPAAITLAGHRASQV